MSSPIPERIGPYPVIRPIARGGMAEVFEVEEPSSGERRALKLLTELKTSLKRFKREFEAMTRLNHPGIVRVFRYGLHDGRQPWMTMEMLDGRPLQERMAELGPPGHPERTLEVMRIGYLLSGSLQYIHDRGLVHRDLKSANIQVLRDGRVKLLDFGTAHLIDPLERITQEGDFVGTFSYAAPEQIVGAQVDHRADIYAFGILLYRLLTGRRPFKAKDPHEVARMHLQMEPKPMLELAPGLPEALQPLVSKMMAKKRKDRPGRAEDVGRELEQIAGQALGLPGFGLVLYDDRSVGRESEHRVLWRGLLESPPGHVVVLHGGDEEERRRFKHQAGRDAAKRGWTAIGCSAGVDPGAELAHALSLLVVGDDPEAEVLREVLQGPWGPRAEVLRPLVPHLARRLLQTRVATLLVVEELSRFGALEVETIARLAREARRSGAPLRLLVGSDDPEDAAVRMVCKRAGSHDAIELGGLDLHRTGLAVAQLLHRRPPPPGAVRRLQTSTGGHPSLLAAVVEDLVSEGRIQVRGTDGDRVEWSLDDSADQDLPDPVRDIFEARLRDLSVPEIRALEVIAIAGGSTASPVIARALGVRAEQVDLLLHGLVDRGLVTWEGLPASPAAIPDSLMVRWLDQSVTPVRRVVVQGLVADAVELQEPSAAQVRVLLGVGRYAMAVQRAMTVAANQRRRGQVADALDLLERAYPHLDAGGLTDGHRLQFQLLHASCVHRLKPMDARAGRALQAAESLATDDVGRASVAYERAQLYAALGHYSNHLKSLEESWKVLEDDKPSRLRGNVALDMADARFFRAELRESKRWYEIAIRDARETNDREVFDRGRVGQARIMLASSDVRGAEFTFADVIETERNHPDPTIRHLATAGWGEALRWQGRWSEAVTPLHEAVAEARQSQSVDSWVALATTAAAVELDLFRLGGAQDLVEEVLQALGPGERLQSRLEAGFMQGRITLASGQLGSAGFQLAEVVQQADKAGFALLAARARAFLAEARIGQGAEGEGKELYKQAMLPLMTAGDHLGLAEACLSRARAVGDTENPDKVFLLVKKLDTSVLRLLAVGERLARARWGRARGEGPEAVKAAKQVFDALIEELDPIEQSAMRVHPWAHELHRAGA